MDLHHPLVPSLLLPLLVGLGGAALLRLALGPETGRRWAGAALGLAALLAVGWMLGWRWPAATLTERLPWLLAAAWALALVLAAWGGRRAVAWSWAALVWALVVAWGGGLGWVGLAAAAILGAGILAALLNSPADRASAAAALVVASLGLAGVAVQSGSLVLFQCAVALAAATGGVALAVWPRARVLFGVAALVAAGLAWLLLAQVTLLRTSASPLALLLLVAVFWIEPLLRRLPLPGRRPLVEPLAVAVLAGALAAGAVALATAQQAAPAAQDDDAYYEPKWSGDGR